MAAASRLAALALLASGIGSWSCGAVESPAAPEPPLPVAVPAGPAPVGDALNMELLGWLDLRTMAGISDTTSISGSGNWGYTSPEGRRFALTGTSRGVSIDEVTEPSRIRHAGFIPGPSSSWREVKTYKTYAYVTTEAIQGLDIIDLRAPSRPVSVRLWNETFASAHTLCIDEDRGLLFANGTRLATPDPQTGIRPDAGMRVLSLADPVNPREVGSFRDYYIHDCVVRETRLYASAINSGFLAVLDISDPARIREITRVRTGRTFTHNSWPTTDGSHLFTTDERADAPVEGWDISDVFRPRRVSTYIARSGTVPHNVMIDGNRLLIAHYTEGVHLLDVSDPAQPSVLGYYDTLPQAAASLFDGAWSAYIFPRSNLIVAGDRRNGLLVLSYTGR